MGKELDEVGDEKRVGDDLRVVGERVLRDRVEEGE